VSRFLGAGVAGSLLVLGLAVAPSPAAAASKFTCEASALRAGVLTAPPIEPITANKGQADCKAAKGPVPALTGLPVPVSARILTAETVRSGSDATPGSQRVGATGGLADLSIGLPALPITLPVDQVPPTAITPVPGGPTVDITAAIKALAPSGKLPAELVGVRGSVAFANAGCVKGKAELNGSSQVFGLRVLGQEVPTDKAVTQTLNVVGGGTIDPSQLKPADLVANVPGLSNVPTAPIQAALDALPDIPIPAQVARLTLKPSEQVRAGSKLTQRALRVQLSIGGQSIADLALGEASVSAAAVQCSASGVADEQLSCTKKRLALVDVVRRGSRVRLFGVADRALVGKQVSIRFLASGRQVARPRVARNGTFTATAPLPRTGLRDSNAARYQARVGRERSLDLKLARRMVVTTLRSSGGRVTIAGRVIRPLGRPVQTIVVQRRISCRRTQTVARIKPSRTGAFRVTVAAPPRTLAATYRLSTRVRKFASNPKLFPTYTLPRAVEIR
jgi:hypothetical protein